MPQTDEQGRCEMDDKRPRERRLERGAAFSLLHKSSPYLNLYPSVADKALEYNTASLLFAY